MWGKLCCLKPKNIKGPAKKNCRAFFMPSILILLLVEVAVVVAEVVVVISLEHWDLVVSGHPGDGDV
jgi:hypothetical protein